MLNLAAIYEDLADTGVHIAWVDEFLTAMQRGVTGMYVNFLADDSVARIAEAYPPTTWKRLAEVKRRYDPDNLFRLNNNIAPA
jgi:FAD/FMN-containing dehydrogenase